MARVIDLMGGPALFESRLDYVFQPNTSGVDLGVNGLGITTVVSPFPVHHHH
jgi:hypothetical protein